MIDADRLHHPTALRLAVTRENIDVTRMQAHRAMISVAATTLRADDGAAVQTGEAGVLMGSAHDRLRGE